MKLDTAQEQFHFHLLQEVRHEMEQRGDHHAVRLCIAILDGHGHERYLFDAIGKVQEEWKRVAPPMNSMTTDQRHAKFVALVVDSLMYAVWTAANGRGFQRAVLEALS